MRIFFVGEIWGEFELVMCDYVVWDCWVGFECVIV